MTVTPPMGAVTEPEPCPVTGNAPSGLDGTGGVDTHVGELPLVGRGSATGSAGTTGSVGRPAGVLTGRDGRPGTDVGIGREPPPTPGSPPAGTSEVTPDPPRDESWVDGNAPDVPPDALPTAPGPCADALPLTGCPELRPDARVATDDGTPGSVGSAGVPDGNPAGRVGTIPLAEATSEEGLPNPPSAAPPRAQTAAPAVTNAMRRRDDLAPVPRPAIASPATPADVVDGLEWLFLIVDSSSRGSPHVVLDRRSDRVPVERRERTDLAVGSPNIQFTLFRCTDLGIFSLWAVGPSAVPTGTAKGEFP